MSKTIQEIAQIILKDPKFIDDIKISLTNVLKDGKIDMADIPEILLLVALGYNKSTKFTVSIDQLPELLTELVNIIIVKYDLIPDVLQSQFNKILQSSITLILLMPRVKATCTSCFGN
ncbi:hypothetical protein crov465 [Cafeteria roenbergensis virus]|uniref:Uncharacterized protein n=1 Tax=Cafeteria roenbergensis virus (strain BV-PW1) TaxID=693272 RepID=E3T5N6_CROVB|nr:hypothetical protein crov465 [Cafeteria roenbergensis virus BV-PW1]ADO67499.1 hypothetical protein crov465 [Cafeteria roenbergensis virus BV-PW1]